jgi:hypothetical protein
MNPPCGWIFNAFTNFTLSQIITYSKVPFLTMVGESLAHEHLYSEGVLGKLHGKSKRYELWQFQEYHKRLALHVLCSSALKT